MSFDILELFARYVILTVFLAWVAAYCCGASIRRGEGAAGAAVRIIATLLVPATLLAFLGAFVWPVTLGISILAAWWQGVGSVGYLTDKLRALWSCFSPVSKVALITLAVAGSLRAGAVLSTPPIDGDGLLYHLPVTAALIQDHSMWFSRALLYPAATELGEAISGSTIANVTGVVGFQLVQILCLLMVAYAWARRAGTGLDGAAATAVVAASLPIVIDQMFTSQNDVFVCTMLAAACVLWRPVPRLAAIAIGLLFAAKLTAFAFVPAIALVMIAFEGWPYALTDLAWAALIAVPWYVRTWIVSGSPLYTVSSLGFSSTLAANLAKSAPFIVAALRIYGGLAAVGGVVALAAWVAWPKRNSFARALPWLALASLLAWIVLPNSAEDVRGTLSQIRQGWSLRYGLLLPFILATSLPIVLDRASKIPFAPLIALVASASAVVRSANLTGSDQPLAFGYAVPLLVALGCLMVAAFGLATPAGQKVKAMTISSNALLVVALAIWSATAAIGGQSVQRLWDASYLQWNLRIPTTAVLLDPRVKASSRIAVVGMRSFPLVGPTFGRRTYDDVIVQSPVTWLAALRRAGVGLLAASGESGSIYESGFLKPSLTETLIAQEPGVCKLATSSYVRLYGLDAQNCTQLNP